MPEVWHGIAGHRAQWRRTWLPCARTSSPARAARSGRHRGRQAVRRSQTFSRHADRAVNQANVSLDSRPWLLPVEPGNRRAKRCWREPRYGPRGLRCVLRTCMTFPDHLSPTTLLPLTTAS